MTERFDLEATELFSDRDSRVIRGLLIPTDDVTKRGGYDLRFAKDSVTFSDRTPALLHHDSKRPVGRLSTYEWTDRGLEIAVKVSKTVDGDEALELASEGVLGFSVGVNIRSVHDEGKSRTVLAGDGVEVSMVAIPAFSKALVDSVSFSEINQEVNMSENTTEQFAGIQSALESINEKLSAGRPTVTPVPVATVTREEPLYDLNGGSARFNFSEDVVASFKGDAAAHQRVDGFINEQFAVASGDVMPGKTPGWRPEVGYSNLRPYGRVLDRVITRGSLSDNQPFAYPILNGVTGTLVAPHVEGVEPALAGGATWGTQTVTPSALSGKVGFNRETIDLIGGMAQNLLFAEMTKASEKAAELRLVALLDGLSLPAGQIKTVNGSNDTLMDNLDAMHLSLLEPQRFNGAVAAPALYSKLFLAKDSTGRRLNTALNPSNANGRTDGLSAITANGLTFIQGRDTAGNGTANSYLIDSSCVYQWLSAPKRLDFDIALAVVYMGFWQYSAEAVTDKSGIIRITTSA